MSNNKLEIFHDFFRSNQHLLKKGDNNWPTDKILFQLAYEHAEDSPITKQAEKFLAQQRVEGSWFSLLNKIKHASKNPNYLTFDLHTNGVQGVHLMEDNRALSWSGLRGVFGRDKTLRLWNLQDGSSKVFEGHNDLVTGVHLMEDNRALSWSWDGTLRLWNLQDGSSKVFARNRWFTGVHLMEDNRALSWSEDKTLRLWNLQDGSSKVFEGHTDWVTGVHLIEDNRALSWSDDKTLRLWNLQDGSSKVFEGHTDRVNGVHLMEDNRALSWSNDGTICLWDLTNGMLAKYYFEGISKVFLTQLSNRILCFSSNRHRILELSD